MRERVARVSFLRLVLRFRFFSIPVEVHFFHLVITGLFATMWASSGSVGGWPMESVRDPKAPDHSTAQVFAVGMWMVMISFSIFVHELGHAFTAKSFGYRPEIRLVSLGGETSLNANETVPWHRSLLVSLAGPMAGLALGFGALLVWQLRANEGPLAFVVSGLAIANIFWSVFNLLPVSPLDGGHIAQTVLMRLFGRKGFLFAQIIGLLMGGLLVAFALAAEQLYIGILSAFWVIRAVTSINAYAKGELPPTGQNHPLEQALQKASELYKSGQYEQSKQLLNAINEQELQPEMRAQVQELLGWVALKSGQGRAALDHFAQVQGKAVAPHALAAAFSLIGDESRAVPLWEMATRASPNEPTVLHEYAGALIRSGREADARRLPNVKMPQAFAAAQRVFFLRNEFADAGRVAEAAYTEAPDAESAYEAACMWARAGRNDDALRLLEAAAKHGFARKDLAEGDEDLKTLRADPRFAAWLSSLGKTSR